MKLRYPAIAAAGASVAVALLLESPASWKMAPVPIALAAVSDWQPTPLQTPEMSVQPLTAFANVVVEPEQVGWTPEPPARPVSDPALLNTAGFFAPDRAEVVLALAAEYDLYNEVRVDGRPTDTMSGDRLAEAASDAETDTGVLVRLQESCTQFSVLQDQNVATATLERL